MKKLTAGIFAAILTIVGVSGANAEIASAKYVDDKVAGHVDTVTAALAGKVDKNANITAGTATKITYDAKGLVTKGENLAATDIPEIPQSKVTNLTTDLGSKAAASDVATLQTKVADLEAANGTGGATTQAIATAKSEAIAAAKTETTTQVKALADGAVADNTEAIEAINDAETGILAQAKSDAASKASAAQVAAEATAAGALATAKTELEGKITAETTARTSAINAMDLAAVGGVDKVITTVSQADGKVSAVAGYDVAHETTTIADDAKEDFIPTARRVELIAANTMGGEIAALQGADAELAAGIQGLTATVNTKAGQTALDAVKATADAAATKTSVDALTTRVGTAETNITNITKDNGTIDTKIAEAVENINTTTGSLNTAVTNAQTTANDAKAAAATNATNITNLTKTVADNKTAADTGIQQAKDAAAAAQTTANAAIPEPTAECANKTNKCVLVSAGKGNFAWEVIARGNGETSAN